MKTRERLIVISQDCDIVADPRDEPCIEALVCQRTGSKKWLASVDRNSARWFVLDIEDGVVAVARYRVHIEKAALLGLTPEPWPGSPDRLERFVRWLGRRYDRPALPDALVDCFQRPLISAMNDLREDSPEIYEPFSAAVAELRVNVPASDQPPFELQLLLLVDGRELSTAAWESMQAVMARIHEAMDPNIVCLAAEPRISSDEEITLAEYLATRPIYLEYGSFEGEEFHGAVPPRSA